jgi:hypothetical protein
MIFRPQPKRREFTLRGRKQRGEETRKPLHFRRPQRRAPSRGANLLWLIVLLILVIFLFRYFRSLGW